MVVETAVLLVAVVVVTAASLAAGLPVGVVVLLLGLVGAGGVAQHLVVDARAGRLSRPRVDPPRLR